MILSLTFNCQQIVIKLSVLFESRHDIKNLTTSSYSVPLKSQKTKLEVIPPKDVEGDTF